MIHTSNNVCAENAQCLVTLKNVSDMLSISTRSVLRMRDRGAMPPAIKLGKSLRWNKEVIEKWISQGCPGCRPAPRRKKGMRI